MTIHAAVETNIGRQDYLVDGLSCYLISENLAISKVSSKWQSALIKTNGELTNVRVRHFGNLDKTTGIVNAVEEHVYGEPVGGLFDEIKLGRSSTTWHNHAAILTRTLKGEYGNYAESWVKLDPIVKTPLRHHTYPNSRPIQDPRINLATQHIARRPNTHRDRVDGGQLADRVYTNVRNLVHNSVGVDVFEMTYRTPSLGSTVTIKLHIGNHSYSRAFPERFLDEQDFLEGEIRRSINTLSLNIFTDSNSFSQELDGRYFSRCFENSHRMFIATRDIAERTRLPIYPLIRDNLHPSLNIEIKRERGYYLNLTIGSHPFRVRRLIDNPLHYRQVRQELSDLAQQTALMLGESLWLSNT